MISAIPLSGPGRQLAHPAGTLVRQISASLHSRHAWSIIPTLLRLPIAAGIAAAYLAGQHELAVGLLVAFVILDIFDGVIARRVHGETPERRAADSFVDKVSVHGVAIAVLWIEPAILPFWLPLLARDLFQSLVAFRTLKMTGLIVTGAGWHVTYTLAWAAWGSIWLLGQVPPLPVYGLLILAGFVTLLDYMRSCGRLVQFI